MIEQSPSGGYHLVQQVMHRIRPHTDQERALLRHLADCGESLSVQTIRRKINTGEESVYSTVSRLEDKGLVHARSAREIEITEDGRAALEFIRGATVR